MKILVTGGAGFIGSHIVEVYQAAGHEVAIIDNFSSGKTANVPQAVAMYEGDIRDAAFVRRTVDDFRPEVINHHAAQVSVVVSTHQPVMDAETNVLGTVNLLQAAHDAGSVAKFIYASSGGAMYGNPVTIPCSEDAAANPVSPYGLSKNVAERYVWLLAPAASTVLRYANVYGPRQDPHGEAGVCALFTNKMLAGEPVQIYGDGSQVRDYVYVEDLADANLKALTSGAGEAFNIATGTGTSTMEVYRTLKKATGYQKDAIMAPERPGEVQAVILSNEKASRQLGWVPRHAFAEGIVKTVDWYKS